MGLSKIPKTKYKVHLDSSLYLDPFVCGPCSVKENIPCSSIPVKVFYENKVLYTPDQKNSFACQALTARVIHALARNESLDFNISGESDFIRFLRFKYGICDLLARNIIDKLKEMNILAFLATPVSVNYEILHKYTSKLLVIFYQKKLIAIEWELNVQCIYSQLSSK